MGGEGEGRCIVFTLLLTSSLPLARMIRIKSLADCARADWIFLVRMELDWKAAQAILLDCDDRWSLILFSIRETDRGSGGG